MTERVRTALLSIAAIGCLVYGFVPPGNPAWIGAAGAILGGETLVRAKQEVHD
jgi:hypothetical protein